MVLFYSGWIVSTSLAGATVGSFTGGALADKFGRTRTFIMDSIPLAIGAFLRLIIINKNQCFRVFTIAPNFFNTEHN